MFKLLKTLICLVLLAVLLSVADTHNFNQLLPSKEQVLEYFQENYSAIKTFSGQLFENLDLGNWRLTPSETQLTKSEG